MGWLFTEQSWLFAVATELTRNGDLLGPGRSWVLATQGQLRSPVAFLVGYGVFGGSSLSLFPIAGKDRKAGWG